MNWVLGASFEFPVFDPEAWEVFPELDVVDLAVEEELLEVVLDDGVFCQVARC